MPKAIQFEKSMAELEDIVKQLERGDLPLEESLKYYEKGINIARQCQDALVSAEQKIEMLQVIPVEKEPLKEENCGDE